jgi:DNA-binding MarR family transcriptional regulator
VTFPPPPTPLPTPLRELLGDLIGVTHRLSRLAATATGSTESPAVWRTLSVLAGGALRLGDLALQSRVTQPTMTKIVQTLEGRGWARSAADPSDGRVRLIHATAEGVAALDAWRGELADRLVPLFEDLTVDERHTLRAAVDLVSARVRVPSVSAGSGEP